MIFNLDWDILSLSRTSRFVRKIAKQNKSIKRHRQQAMYSLALKCNHWPLLYTTTYVSACVRISVHVCSNLAGIFFIRKHRHGAMESLALAIYYQRLHMLVHVYVCMWMCVQIWRECFLLEDITTKRRNHWLLLCTSVHVGACIRICVKIWREVFY